YFEMFMLSKRLIAVNLFYVCMISDGEPNESSGAFSLSNFWEIMNEAVKSVSQEATKLSVMFSKPPLPSEERCVKIAQSVQKSVLTLTTVYFWLPKSQGVTLRKLLRDATAQVLDDLAQLLQALLSSPGGSLSQEQLMSTGGVWAACDRFNQLPKDNRSAVLSVLASCVGLVKDALEEMEQALAEAQDPFGDVLDDEDDDDEGNQDTHWSEADRLLIAQCQGLMKASGASLRRLCSAVRNNSTLETEENITQLDDLADAAREISPRCVEYRSWRVCKVVCVLKKVLEITRSSHVCVETDVSWVEFLNSAAEHNLEKIRSLLLSPSV
uniref:Cyclin D-type binding-protein 1 n=1 Tax=Cyprinus carpio TaxID=7962 RepID=A0A8C2JY30_CYPCA